MLWCVYSSDEEWFIREVPKTSAKLLYFVSLASLSPAQYSVNDYANWHTFTSSQTKKMCCIFNLFLKQTQALSNLCGYIVQIFQLTQNCWHNVGERRHLVAVFVEIHLRLHVNMGFKLYGILSRKKRVGFVFSVYKIKVNVIRYFSKVCVITIVF